MNENNKVARDPEDPDQLVFFDERIEEQNPEQLSLIEVKCGVIE